MGTDYTQNSNNVAIIIIIIIPFMYRENTLSGHTDGGQRIQILWQYLQNIPHSLSWEKSVVSLCGLNGGTTEAHSIYTTFSLFEICIYLLLFCLKLWVNFRDIAFVLFFFFYLVWYKSRLLCSCFTATIPTISALLSKKFLQDCQLE